VRKFVCSRCGILPEDQHLQRLLGVDGWQGECALGEGESACWGFPPSVTSDQITKILIRPDRERRESAKDWPGKAGAAAGPAA
jgi:hypothetical protein